MVDGNITLTALYPDGKIYSDSSILVANVTLLDNRQPGTVMCSNELKHKILHGADCLNGRFDACRLILPTHHF
jgi:hypothetical protein